MECRSALAALAALSLALGAAADPATDLGGIWINDAGEEVELQHLSGPGRVSAIFTARSNNGACPIAKPPDDRRTYYVDGLVSGGTLTGKMMRCTKSENMVNACGLPSAYETTFTATVSENRIEGTWDAEGYARQKPDERGCEAVRDARGNKKEAFWLVRCGSDPASLCKALGTARASVKVLGAFEQQPTPDEWTALLAKQRPVVAADLERVAVFLCGDTALRGEIEAMKQSLESLGSADEALLDQRRKAARIDIGLEGIQQGRCGATAGVPAGPCQPLSLKALDAMQAYMKRVDEAKPKLVSEEDGYKQVGDGLKEALEQLQDEARSARDGPSTVGDLDQYLEEHDRKIGKLKELLGYWEQVKAASCVPSGVLELLRKLAREQKSGIEHEATCTELCGETADWIVEMTGDPRQRKTLFQGCVGACN